MISLTVHSLSQPRNRDRPKTVRGATISLGLHKRSVSIDVLNPDKASSKLGPGETIPVCRRSLVCKPADCCYVMLDISNCRSLKSLTLGNGGHYVLKSGNEDSNIVNLLECLPVAETLSIPLDNYYYIIRAIFFTCQKDMLSTLILLIKSSPNLEKLKINNGNFDVDYVFREAGLLLEVDICSFTLKDYADIWLEHLNELQIRSFKNQGNELNFVKLILAKSHVLKKVMIYLDHEEVVDNEELQICKVLLSSPRASPLRWPPRVTLGRLLPHAKGLGFKPRRGGFPSGAKKEWGLSLKAKVRVLHTTQLDVTVQICLILSPNRVYKTELQPHVDQLMVPIHHSPDKTVVGATSLSFALDVFNVRVPKIRENIAGQMPALRDVLIPLSEPFSAEVLTGARGTFDTVSATAVTTTALSTTLASASTVALIFLDDYMVAGTDDQAGADGNADPFPNVDDAELNILYASVTSYGPSYLRLSFPVSSTRLALLVRYTRSTFAVLSVGMPISAGMTASASYVNENGVSLLLDFVIVRLRFSLSTRPLGSLLKVFKDWSHPGSGSCQPYLQHTFCSLDWILNANPHLLGASLLLSVLITPTVSVDP
nr:hypothetical protein [Tanacetum cinerariifolium]